MGIRYPAPNVLSPAQKEVAEEKARLLHKHYRSQASHDWFDELAFLGLSRLRGVQCRNPHAEGFILEKACVTFAARRRPGSEVCVAADAIYRLDNHRPLIRGGPSVTKAPIVVVGTGFAGFGAGHRLEEADQPYVVYDRNAHIGGHTASHQLPGGFVFDEGPHVSFAKDERIRQILADAVGGRYQDVRIGLDSYWQGRILTHPVQVNLHGLPVDLIVRILLDLVAESAAPADEPPPADYETWLRRSYGDTFAETFPMKYGDKYHTTPMSNLTTDWLGPRMYRPSVEEALRGALSTAPVRDVHYVTHFRYPTEGGYEAYLASWIGRSDVRLEHEIVGIDPSMRTLRFANGGGAAYGELISSIPLPDLVPMIDGAPEAVLAAAKAACVLVGRPRQPRHRPPGDRW